MDRRPMRQRNVEGNSRANGQSDDLAGRLMELHARKGMTRGEILSEASRFNQDIDLPQVLDAAINAE
ncbi:hypothetical protein Y032_0254g299 [Ancylostoma ceylanicum]|nr:hypothetical protein Y032_0254g299 [Ancylostoma ceylanicum]